MLQGQRDLTAVGQMLLSEMAPLVNAQYGAIYQMNTNDGASCLQVLSSYAGLGSRSVPDRVAVGAGLVGQCAVEKRRILLDDVPEDYVRISSGLGEPGRVT